MSERKNIDWFVLRRTGTLHDVIDEPGFLNLIGISNKGMLRNWMRNGGVYNIHFPQPIFRPDGKKAIWDYKEARKFALDYRARKVTRSK